jgi:hypothetical protein
MFGTLGTTIELTDVNLLSMNKRYLTISKILFAVSDLMLLNLCLILCMYLSGVAQNIPTPKIMYDLTASTVIWCFSTWLFNLYSEQTIVSFRSVRRATLRSFALYLFAFHIYAILFINIAPPGIYLYTFYLAVIASFSLARYTYKSFETLLIRLIDKNEAVNVFAIASIGGHWIQLLRLMPLFSANNVSFLSTKSSLSDTVAGHRYLLVPDANRNNKLKLMKCCLSIGAKIIISRPKVIVTTGAAPGLFGIIIGKILGVKTIWIDSIANVEQLSLSGKIASKVADRVYTQWEHLSTPKIIYAGNILEG